MDSPESTTRIHSTGATITVVNATNPNSASSNSPPVQESPFSNFVSSFSPLNIGNAPHVSQGFIGLNSPPLIFATPRLHPIRETGILTRPEDPQFSRAEAAQDNDRSNKIHVQPDDWDKSAVSLTTDLQDSGVINYERVQHSGSPERVDKYLADPVEGGSTCSEHSVDQIMKQSPNNANAETDSLRGILEFENKSVARAGTEMDLKEQVLVNVEQLEHKEEQDVVQRRYNQCPSSEFQEKCESSSFQNARDGCGEERNFSSEMPSELMKSAQALEDCGKNAEAISNRLLCYKMLESEVNQHQRGMSRRCLQFEEAQPKATANTNSSLNVASEMTLSRSAVSAECDIFYSNASLCSRQLINVSQPMIRVVNPCNNVESIVPLSKPSGIGLHLNSIVKTAPFHDASMKLTDGSMSILEIESSAIMSYHSLENPADTEVAGSAVYEQLQTNESLKLTQTIDDHATSYDNGKFVPEDSDNFEHFNQQSPKRRKKKSSSGIDDDGCKRCNCKKTKCLKLYCDCFAAGIYCDETCSCQGCLNKPECEDTVLQKRQQIESRNPLAFAPKIVQQGSEFSMNIGKDENLTTPSSARHKRGCNCKKSMCLKKYCECYQSNVGCSSGCRCENCKNIYGKKDDYLTGELVGNRAISGRPELDDNIEIGMAKKGSVHQYPYHTHKLTPITPSFQHSDHGKGAPKSQIIVRRYHPSPDSDHAILPSQKKSPRSQRNSDDNNMTLETGREVLDVGSYHQETDYNNSEITEYLSSRFGPLIDTSRLTPLPNHSPTVIPSSASLGSSLRWRCSPITPGTNLGGNKSPQELDSDTGIYSVLDDETPEILKDASTPVKPVKVSSPSRKRVSPPQRCLNEIESSSSRPLKSGRKFILKAVPSFPPLTPCIDSKSLTKQITGDSQ